MSIGRSEIQAALASLAGRRPVFHSEADFQHELAIQLRDRIPGLGVRLEVPLEGGELDILLRTPSQRIGVELKFARGRLDATIHGERFQLSGADPKDVARYGYWRDVERIERWIAAGDIETGFVLLLANSPDCWEASKRNETNHDAFRFHEGSVVRGVLGLRRPPPKRKDYPNVSLRGEYTCSWRDYSNLDGEKYGRFRSLLVQIGP